MKRLMTVPGFDTLLSYKGVHALCTTNGKTGELKVDRYVMVLIGGAQPLWGCWTVRGRFVCFYGGRTEIEKAYPQLVWRRKMATWMVTDIEGKSVAERRAELSGYGKFPEAAE